MRKLSDFIMGCIMLILPALTFTSCGKVGPGEEGVLVKTPWFFGHGGVDDEPVSTGLIWTAPTTTCYTFPVIPVQYDEKFADIMSSDNTPVDLSAHALIRIIQGRTPVLLSRFGEKWYENDIQKDFCNEVRNEISKWPMMELTCRREIYDNMSRRADTAKFNVEITIGTTNMMKTKNVRKRGTVADDE